MLVSGRITVFFGGIRNEAIHIAFADGVYSCPACSDGIGLSGRFVRSYRENENGTISYGVYDIAGRACSAFGRGI